MAKRVWGCPSGWDTAEDTQEGREDRARLAHQQWASSGTTGRKTVLKGERLNPKCGTIPVFSMGPEHRESRANVRSPVGTERQDAQSLRHQKGKSVPVALEGYPPPHPLALFTAAPVLTLEFVLIPNRGRINVPDCEWWKGAARASVQNYWKEKLEKDGKN